jgi:hypothetical protein
VTAHAAGSHQNRCRIPCGPEADDKLKRLYRLIEDGMTDLDEVLKETFTTGSVPFRKAYSQSLIEVIEVDDHLIRIKGSKDLLEKAVLASRSDRSSCSETST